MCIEDLSYLFLVLKVGLCKDIKNQDTSRGNDMNGYGWMMDKIRNEKSFIRQELQLQPTLDIIEWSQLKWFEHLNRMNTAIPTRKIYKVKRHTEDHAEDLLEVERKNLIKFCLPGASPKERQKYFRYAKLIGGSLSTKETKNIDKLILKLKFYLWDRIFRIGVVDAAEWWLLHSIYIHIFIHDSTEFNCHYLEMDDAWIYKLQIWLKMTDGWGG